MSDHIEVCLIHGLEKWSIELTTGDEVIVFCDGYGIEDDCHVFTALARGTPHYLVETARVPSHLVKRVLGPL